MNREVLEGFTWIVLRCGTVYYGPNIVKAAAERGIGVVQGGRNRSDAIGSTVGVLRQALASDETCSIQVMTTYSGPAYWYSQCSRC